MDAPEVQRLTLPMSRKDMKMLEVIADRNLRSMTAQAMFMLRAALVAETERQPAET